MSKISFSQEQKTLTENINNEEIKEQISDALKQKKKARIIGKEVVNKLDNQIKKDKLIFQLRKDCKFHEVEKKTKINNLNYVNLTRENCEKNKLDAGEFFKDIKKYLGEFGKKLDNFEQKINELKDERKNILSSSYSILEKKSNDKFELEKKKEEINSKIKKKIAIIDDINKRYNTFKKQLEDEQKILMVEENKEIDKYNKLFKRYRELLTKYNIYEQEGKDDNNDDISKSRKTYEDNLVKEDLRMKLTEAKQKNLNLKKNLEEINNKIESISRDESIIINHPVSSFKRKLNKNYPPINSGSTVNTTTGNRDITFI